MTQTHDSAAGQNRTGRVYFRYAYEIMPEVTDGAIASPVVRADAGASASTDGDVRDDT